MPVGGPRSLQHPVQYKGQRDIQRRASPPRVRLDRGNPLPKLMRDVGLYEMSGADYMDILVDPGHGEYTRDVMVEFLRVKNHKAFETFDRVYGLPKSRGIIVEKCHYHQHNESHPRCVPEPERESASFRLSEE